MKRLFLPAILVSLLVFSGCATLSAPHTPPEGSAERDAILQATREALVRQGRKDLVPVVVDLKVHDGWAWIEVKPQSTDKRNRYQSQSALLQEQKPKWKLLEWMPSEQGTDYPKYFTELKAKYPNTPRDILPQ